MFAWLRGLFDGDEDADADGEADDPEARFDAQRRQALEAILGPVGDAIGDAVVPLEDGGTVDLFYFCKGQVATTFATMQLISYDPKRSVADFELVACTRLAYEPGDFNITESSVSAPKTPFQVVERRTTAIFTAIARLVGRTDFAAGQICALDLDDGTSAQVLLDRFDTKTPLRIGKRNCRLLLCLELKAEEATYAASQGVDALLGRLRGAGVYPCTDQNRSPVV